MADLLEKYFYYRYMLSTKYKFKFVTTYDIGNYDLPDDLTYKICAICDNSMLLESVVITDCKHVFHDMCYIYSGPNCCKLCNIKYIC